MAASGQRGTDCCRSVQSAVIDFGLTSGVFGLAMTNGGQEWRDRGLAEMRDDGLADSCLLTFG